MTYAILTSYVYPFDPDADPLGEEGERVIVVEDRRQVDGTLLVETENGKLFDVDTDAAVIVDDQTPVDGHVVQLWRTGAHWNWSTRLANGAGHGSALRCSQAEAILCALQGVKYGEPYTLIVSGRNRGLHYRQTIDPSFGPAKP